MIYLTAEQILFIHSRLIEETGGSYGVRNLSLLQAAVERPKATFDAEELYPDIFFKAAALMHSLVGNHPFVDGNKRAGITAAALFLRLNGYILEVDEKDLFAFTMRVSQGSLDLAEIAGWFEENCN